MSLSSPDMSELAAQAERDLDAERKRRQRARERQIKCRLKSNPLDSNSVSAITKQSFCIACGFQHGLQRQCVCVRCHTSHPDSDCPASDLTSHVVYQLPAGTHRGK